MQPLVVTLEMFKSTGDYCAIIPFVIPGLYSYGPESPRQLLTGEWPEHPALVRFFLTATCLSSGIPHALRVDRLVPEWGGGVCAMLLAALWLGLHTLKRVRFFASPLSRVLVVS